MYVYECVCVYTYVNTVMYIYAYEYMHFRCGDLRTLVRVLFSSNRLYVCMYVDMYAPSGAT
jgi:hypothetical protein